MASKRDYYDVLGIKRGADAAEIKRAHRKLARELHPDVNKATNASEKFNEVQEAYDTLSNVEKRDEHDQWIEDQGKRSPLIATNSHPASLRD